MQNDITNETYRRMYYDAMRRSDGLRAMAESMIEADKKIIVEIKTSGNNNIRDEIIKLSIIDTENNVLYDNVLQPEKDFNRELRLGLVNSLDGISKEQMVNAPMLKEQLYIIDKILLSAKAIIGYSLGKTMSFLRKSGCVWRSDYDFISIEEAFSNADNKNKNAALVDCAAHFDYHWNSDTPHSTLDNCRAVLHCYNKMLESGYELMNF